jgi:hypothetical protein
VVPGGYFRLQVYDKSNPAMGTFNEEALRDKDYGMIGNGYSPEELRALLAEHGLEIVSLEHTKPWIWATACRPGPRPAVKPSLNAESLRVSEIPKATRAGYSERGAQHFARREWKLALVCFDQMSETGLQQPNLNYVRAQCLFQLGRWKECERAIFAELKIQPNHPDTRGLLRELRQQQKPVAVEA